MSYFAKKKELIDKQILKDIDDDNEYEDLVEYMKDYPLRGGKRLRPILCMLSCEMFGGRAKDAIHTAVSIEHFQSAVLIHDDIEDKSLQRRGKPCLHHIIGVPLAINVGDALYAVLMKSLARNNEILTNKVTVDVFKELTNLFFKCTKGQHKEISWVSSKNWDITEDDYIEMVYYKTAWYTGITPLRAGAVVAGASKKVLNKISEIGKKMGVAFQIADDLLDLREGIQHGKDFLGDLYEGKRTLMMINLLSKCTDDEKQKIIEIMNKEREKKTIQEVDYVYGLIKKYDCIQYAKEIAVQLADEAKELLDGLSVKNAAKKKLLKDLIDFFVNRDY